MAQQTSITVDRVRARPILDSRGYPTVEVRISLKDGSTHVAASPAGASTGKNEAVERRDQNVANDARTVTGAVGEVNTEIATLLCGRAWHSIRDVDAHLARLDGSPGYSRLGANAVVAVSMAMARALAHGSGQPLYRWVAEQAETEPRLPVPHFNVLNGGAHAANPLDFQEFMIAPVGASCEAEAVRTGADVYHALQHLVADRYESAGLGDEGGLAPNIEDPREALDLLVAAVRAAGHTAGVNQVAIALDVAATSLYLGQGRYRVNGIELTRSGLVDYYQDLIGRYPIRSIEDGFSEDDQDGWAAMELGAGGRVQTVGDDLYVTDPERIRHGAAHRWSNAVLIKPNQIGTVTQTLQAIRSALQDDLAVMISHRSGETTDSFIADLAVGAGTGQIKAGAPAHGERVAKYNRLTEIELDHPEYSYGLS